MQGGPPGRSLPPSQAHRRAGWRGRRPVLAGASLAVAMALLWLVVPRGPGTAAPATLPPSHAGATDPSSGPGTTPSPVLVTPPAGTHLPALTSQPLPGGPSVVAWYQADATHLQIVRWSAATGRLAPVTTLDTWADPSTASPVERTVVAAPDGRTLAFREAVGGDQPRERLRIFDSRGRQVWSLPAGEQYPWALVWSADGSRLAMATSHLLVLDRTGGDTVEVTVRATVEPAASGAQTVPLAFSADGSRLFVYPSTSFYPDYWGTLSSLDIATGHVSPLGGVPDASTGAAGRLAPSNGTTQLDAVDPTGGRVVVVTDAGAAIRTATATTPVPVTSREGGVAVGAGWEADGTLVVATRVGARPAAGFELATVGPTGGAAAPSFSVRPGDFTADLLGVRQGFALIGLSAAADTTRQGDDELVMVRLSDLATGICLATGQSVDGRGLHLAGWVR